MLLEYECFKCGDRFDILWPSYKESKNSAICGCGNKAKRLYGCRIIIDTWSPMGGHDNDAQRDIEHFEKMKSQGKTTMYNEDRTKQNISVNLKEAL